MRRRRPRPRAPRGARRALADWIRRRHVDESVDGRRFERVARILEEDTPDLDPPRREL